MYNERMGKLEEILPFIHDSYAEEMGLGKDNERLEFLGDAFLHFYIALRLYHALPQSQEGEMSQIKNYLISNSYLATKAKELNLGKKLKVSRAADKLHIRENERTLACTFEAYVGYYFLKKGLKKTLAYLDSLFPELHQPDTLLSLPFRDAKTLLQEKVQGKGFPTPSYTTKRKEGSDHQPVYEATVWIEGHPYGTGRGTSKREAQQEAAAYALQQWEERYEQEEDR